MKKEQNNGAVYIVMSLKEGKDGELYNALETRRTDRTVAEEDVAIIKWLTGRNAWIVE